MKTFINSLLAFFKAKKTTTKELQSPQTPFQKYCDQNPWAPECRIYEV